MKRYLVSIFALFFCFSLSAKELNVELLHVDTVLVYREDGKADISVKTRWNVSSGAMSGFYFSGEKNAIQFDLHKSWAEGFEHNTRQEFPLDILPLAEGGYDIIIADAKSLSGLVDFVFTYRVNLAASGHTSLVDEKDRLSDKNNRLFYFNWAPVDWDLTAKSRTTEIIFPISIDDLIITDSETKQRKTELFLQTLGLNISKETIASNTKIDWYEVEGLDKKSYLSLRFYQENLREKESQPIILYLDAKSDLLVDNPMIGQNILSDTGDSFSFQNWEDKNLAKKNTRVAKILYVLFFLFFSFSAFSLLIVFLKQKEKVKSEKKEVLKMLFPNTETVAVRKNIHPIEIAFLLAFPIVDFIYLVLESLFLAGKIQYKKSKKLRIEKKKRAIFDTFENDFLSCFDDEGFLVLFKIERFYTKGIKKTKTDMTYDLTETIAYWSEKITSIQFDSLEDKPFVTYWWTFSIYAKYMQNKFEANTLSLFISPVYYQIVGACEKGKNSPYF
jgi:hypothetical protein